ncbi:MAG: tetratricopeptide repeat protein [Armatimonadetes bacterium]|nr:tetratricopeptide repeat protein [Armatimonadota bacterium]
MLVGFGGLSRSAFGAPAQDPPKKQQAPEIEQAQKLIKDGKYAEAETIAKKCVEKSPDDPECNYQLGRAIFYQDRFADALPCFQKVTQLLPKFSGGYKFVGDCYFNQKQFPQAVAAYGKAVELEPDESDNYVDFGNALDAAGKEKEAEAQYAKALEINPDNSRAMFEMAVIFYNGKRYDDAEKLLLKGLLLDSQNPFAYANLGDVSWIPSASGLWMDFPNSM